MRGFDSAGGVVTTAFWELAPIGQPLVYPPLFHLLLLGLYKAGLGIMDVARISSVLPAILLFAVIFAVTNGLHSPKRAFFTTLAACIPYSFFLKMTITVPAAISLIFIMLAFYALARQKIAACSIFLALVFYTHPGLPWMACAAFILYGLSERKARRDAFTCVLYAVCLSLPQIMHAAANMGRLAGPLGIPMPEGRMYELYPLIYIFAGIGLVRAACSADAPSKRIGLFALCLLAAFLPMAVNYRFRFLSAEGLLPVLLVAGAGLEAVYDRFLKLLKLENAGLGGLGLYTAAFTAVFMFFSPSFSMYIPLDPPYNKHEFSFHLKDSTAVNLLPAYKRHTRPFEIIMVDDLVEKWVKIVGANTSASDIICSNDTFIGSMLSALSGRANSARMFLEINEPDIPISEFGSARLALWTREYNGKFSSDINECVMKFGYTIISMDEGAAIMVKPVGAHAYPVKPLIRSPFAFLALAAALYAAFAGLLSGENRAGGK
ncbi:MAG: hypothetical protein WC481_03500 [Candidatus Omnitrophota bacterium]